METHENSRHLRKRHIEEVGLKPICQVRIDYIIDPTLDFVKNLDIPSRSSRPNMAAVFNTYEW